MSDHDARWIFDLPPASQARRGGDPSSHVFERDLATFVREVVQNANDQAIAQPTVVFRILDLAGDALHEFLDALSWSTLAPHLSAAAREGNRGASIKAALDELDDTDQLLLLVVEDRGTIGLTGGEAEDDSHFTALCRDTLYSHKADSGAGGSFGLGKSVMWSFSGISTVLFNSTLSTEAPGQTSPRLIGRTELPSHAIDVAGKETWYTGQGWLGAPVDAERGRRAESLWNRDARALAKRLHLSRDDVTGTSIGIVGFRDPTSDEELTPDAFLARMGRAAVENFWPAMSRPMEPLSIGVDAPDDELRMLAPDLVDDLQPFVHCLRHAERAGEALEEVGDVARADVPIEIPAMRGENGHDAVTGRVTLLATLLDEPTAYSDQIAMFRGPGMVVRYWSIRRLALGAPSFCAVLLCGHARSWLFEDADATDGYVEAFLRAAEPPGHDKWHSTPVLKTRYKRGYRKGIETMQKQVRQALKQLVIPTPAAGRRGPDKLRKRFPVGSSEGGSTGRLASPFVFEDVTLTWSGTRWTFFGRIRPVEATDAPWSARLFLQPVAEDGQRLASRVPIDVFDADIPCELSDGEATLEAGRETQGVEFSGESASIREGEVELVVRGELGEAV